MNDAERQKADIPWSLQQRVENVNKTFPKVPMTVYDKGWIYGVWYLGTSWTPVVIHGQHPPHYVDRLTALFADCPDWLHAPSGIIPHGQYGSINRTTLDLVSRAEGCPQYIGSVTDLPFDDESFDVIETDPPYTDKDSKIYGTPKYPRNKARDEFHRVLRPGGYLCWLDTRYPSYRRKDWKLVGLIAVVTGFLRVTRVCSIFQKEIS